jgi:purine-nucleoside phosphorylase
MSIHIGAQQGQIAPTVLLPGDPLRARHIAETMLEEVFCYNEVRGMLGYTGRKGMDYAPAASFHLLLKAYEAARALGASVYVGGIFSGDTFYNDDPEWWKKWAAYGALACEMETNALYTLAAKFKVDALSILTVSDSLVTGEESTAQQRERDFPQMAKIALEISP